MSITYDAFESINFTTLLENKKHLVIFIVDSSNVNVKYESHEFAIHNIPMYNACSASVSLRVEWDVTNCDDCFDITPLSNVPFTSLVIISQVEPKNSVFIDFESIADLSIKFERLYLKSISFDSVDLNIILNNTYFSNVVLENTHQVSWTLSPIFYKVEEKPIVRGTRMTFLYNITAIVLRDFWKIKDNFDMNEIYNEIIHNDITDNNLIVILCYKVPITDDMLELYDNLNEFIIDKEPIYKFMIYLLSLFDPIKFLEITDTMSTDQQYDCNNESSVTTKNKIKLLNITTIIQRACYFGHQTYFEMFVDNWCKCINNIIDDGIYKYIDY